MRLAAAKLLCQGQPVTRALRRDQSLPRREVRKRPLNPHPGPLRFRSPFRLCDTIRSTNKVMADVTFNPHWGAQRRKLRDGDILSLTESSANQAPKSNQQATQSPATEQA